MNRIASSAMFIVVLGLLSLEPDEPQTEIKPYMQVEHSFPECNVFDVNLWHSTEVMKPINKEDKLSEYTESEIEILERMTMSEASVEPYDCKVATCVTAIKRAKMHKKPIEQVIYEPYQYSLADNGKPTDEVKRAVLEAIETEGEYPDTMIYFRADYYHDFGVPYKVYGNHYFSLEEAEK